jgi:hypothetical protein
MSYKLLKNKMFMIVLSKPEENENEFGEFVGYQGGSGSGASQAQTQPKVQDLFDINDSMFVFIHT